jgi:predicted PurR-regulated permease PerM
MAEIGPHEVGSPPSSMSSTSVDNDPTEKLSPVPHRVYGVEKAAYVLTGVALLFVFQYHLVGALVAGLFAYTILHRGARFLRGPRLSHGAAKFVAAGILGMLAAGATTGLVVFLVGFARGRVGDLPALFHKLADALDNLRGQLGGFGISAPWLDNLDDSAIHVAVADWLRDHGALLTHAGREAGVFVIHALVGILLGLILFFRGHSAPTPGPLALALGERARRLGAAFDGVVLAQVEVSALNTVVTAVYLLVILPLFGAGLPLSGTLVLLTFLAGLLPIVGNVISVAAIVAMALGVSLKVAVWSLAFFLVLHKLLYFVNARIVGARIGAAAWEILLAMVAFEAAFGMPGLVLAPILYAYVKRELADRSLV